MDRQCWHNVRKGSKPIKEIRRENGKPKKKYIWQYQDNSDTDTITTEPQPRINTIKGRNNETTRRNTTPTKPHPTKDKSAKRRSELHVTRQQRIKEGRSKPIIENEIEVVRVIKDLPPLKPKIEQGLNPS